MAQDNREVVLNRKQAVGISIVGVVILVFVFALGVLFGRNMANRKLPKEESKVAQAALAPEQPKPVPSATVEQPAPATGGTSIQQKIEQQKVPAMKVQKGETVGKAGKKTQPETKPPAGKETAKTAPVTAKPEEAKKTETKKAGTKPAEATKTAAKTTEPKKTETKAAPAKTQTVPSPTKTGPSIQVASYPDKAGADDLVKKLKSDKWKAYDAPTEIPGKGTYYRVYVGPYDDLDQAKKALAIFKSREPKYKDAFIRK